MHDEAKGAGQCASRSRILNILEFLMTANFTELQLAWKLGVVLRNVLLVLVGVAVHSVGTGSLEC